MLAVKAKYENGTVRWERQPPVEGLHDLIVVFDPADEHVHAGCDTNMALGQPATGVRKQAIRQMQAMYRSIPSDVSLADELIAERRREAANE